MADISGIGASGESSFRASGIERAHTEPGRLDRARRERQADSVSLSEAARTASQIEAKDTGSTELTSRVRAELDAGTYVTQDKLDTAVEHLLDDILRGQG